MSCDVDRVQLSASNMSCDVDHVQLSASNMSCDVRVQLSASNIEL